MLPSASERVRTHPGRSEQVQTRLRTYENFKKLAKTSRKFRETRARAVVVLVWLRRWIATEDAITMAEIEDAIRLQIEEY